MDFHPNIHCPLSGSARICSSLATDQLYWELGAQSPRHFSADRFLKTKKPTFFLAGAQSNMHEMGKLSGVKVMVATGGRKMTGFHDRDFYSEVCIPMYRVPYLNRTGLIIIGF